MNRPLYEAARGEPLGLPSGGHAGLWFERFFDRFDADWQLGDSTAKSGWIDSIAGKDHGDREALRAATDRQSSLAKDLGGRSQDFEADWRFVTGLGLAHPVENGFLWHHTLGVPYLPGAAVKGLVRAWVSQWWDAPSEEARKQRLLDWFGSDDTGNPKGFRTGGFIFFDALPIKPVTLVRDVMTPHAGKWYEQGGNIEDPARQPEAVPADWHDPIPVPFLVAQKPHLRFAIAPRDPAHKGELDQVMEALGDALDWLGAGAKTAAGYGRMRDIA
ncbi:CRISPR-associated RAMP protein, Cmr6 family [Thioalkalivibrio sulfidiphilus HL-EbGr7]|uniref:CRISPR-associated RAMP protein, Cmr6 family n=1 Tax=Thioalkalivibrio sulfidiphilus (strain HL-EbGR7) TaxID=396588 RepID=B8GSH3_THISH|nr:type III-B CRISPR module RAMP protein Cmr6 [Thioalkalivibrio sulfidiphilus]ACL72877.1 CRISPR-associated RAMP protein, Cmr6 family [Thioalkalivibrio sulfidiphilus HL-EbGr7]